MNGGSIRVLFVDHESRLSGGEQDLLDLIVALGNRIDAHVALPSEGPLAEALREAGATIHIVPMSEAMLQLSRWELPIKPWNALKHPLAVLTASRRLSRLIRDLEPAVVHTNSMKGHLLAALPARFAGIPLVWHVRDILGQGWLRKIFGGLARRLPSVVVCISQAVAAQFEDRKIQTRVVYNGIEIDRFTKAPNTLRTRFGATSEQILIGIVGQIAWWKGQDLLVEAAAMTRENDSIKFVIVGECLFPENEGEYDRALRDRVEELGLSEQIAFAGWTDRPEEAMAALDILVHASRLPEPFGRVLVEGMAAGKPVVASSLGAGPELVSPAEGRVVDPTQTRVLADTLLVLAGDRETLSALGEAARNRASDFDISHTAEGVLNVYRELGVLDEDS